MGSVRVLVNVLYNVPEQLGSILAIQLLCILFLPNIQPCIKNVISEGYAWHFMTSKDGHIAELGN